MPRRMSQSHEDLRRAAVDFAHEVVRGEGLAALNVRRIAADLGCSVGTIYNLFVDLDALLLEVAARVLDDMFAAVFAEGLPAAPEARLVEIARRYIRFAAAERRAWSMVFRHEPAHDRPTPDWHLARIGRLVAALEEVVAAALPAAECDSRAVVEVLWASVHGIAALSLEGKLGFVAETEAEALAERAVRALLVGLSAPEPAAGRPPPL